MADDTTSTPPSNLGSMYSQDSNGYWSTNPSNPNASRYDSSGNPVATVGYDNQQTGQHYDGYATPQQFQQILGAEGNAQAESGLLSNMLSSGQLNQPISSAPIAPTKGTTQSGSGGSGYSLPSSLNPTFTPSSSGGTSGASLSSQISQAATNPGVTSEMQANSAKWQPNPNNDPAITASNNALHQQNLQLAAQNGLVYDPNTGTYSQIAAPQSDGTLHMNVNGQAGSDVKVFQGNSFDSAHDIASQLGLDYKADPTTGQITIGGVKINPTSYDKNGDAIVGVRSVADALGYKIGYDDKTKTITITGKNPEIKDTVGTTGTGTGDTTGQGAGTGTGNGTGGQNGSIDQWSNFWNSQGATQGQQMPIQQQFNPDWNSYYQQAHSQIDPLYNTQYNALMSKQGSDISGMDQKMNSRGIFTSGIAQAAEDDLRAKTSDSVASLFNKQMSDIEKTAQTLYSQAYKQYSDGNSFALKYNQDQITNYMNQQKQVFTQWLGTQKLDLSQQQYALNAWDKMATMQLNQMKATLPYEYQTANNAANNQTSMEKALLPYQSMTAYQQATTQEKAQMDAAINYFKQQGINIDTSKLMESIRHDQATENLAGQRLTVQMANNQQNFNEKLRMDNANIDKANAQLTDTAKRTQLDGLKSELNTTAQRINSFVSNSQQAPQTLVDNYNAIKDNIEKIITVNGLGGITTTTGTGDGNFDANNQY